MMVDHLSSSLIKTYQQCPLKYWAIYIEKMPQVEPHPLTRLGLAVHEMMEAATNCRIQGHHDHQRHDPMFWRDTAILENKVEPYLHGDIDTLVANAVRWGYFRNVHRTAGCEVELGFALPDGTKVTGFIDRLDLMPPDADIVDIKTQKNAFEPDELEDNWQARIYNIGARKIRPEITGKATVSFWVLRHQVQRVVLTAKDAENDIGRLVDIMGEIRACNNPEGRPSGLCPWCPYEKKCPDRDMPARERLRRARR